MTPGPLDKDEDESKTERAFGHTVLFLLKHPATWPLLLGGAAAWGWMRPVEHKAEDVYWDKAELRAIMRAEIAPVRAGMEELAKAQSPRVQVSVLQAMMKADRKNQEVQ